MAHLSHRTVYRALRSGALAGEKVGALWRIRPAAVESWATQARPASSPESGAAVVPGTGVAGGNGLRPPARFARATSYKLGVIGRAGKLGQLAVERGRRRAGTGG